jgi:glycosyltransferase involved in cell wall biosynthesis
VLAVNWLDLKNPQAGGAEVHFFEIFKRLVAGGDEVTLICSGWPDAPRRATVDGLEVLRCGGRQTFALCGRAAVRRALRERSYDVVVEDINKLPLYLTTVTRLPVYVIIPHLFGTTAFREAAWPIASVVWLAERPIPWVYRRAAFHAISRSTRDDLVARGVPSDRIRVIHPGVDSVSLTPDPEAPRTRAPTFLYVGRLKRYKGIDVAIRALAKVRVEFPEAALDVAGSGDAREYLEGVARDAGVSDAVRFLGFVSEEEKVRLLRQAWSVVFPSVKEGWGITNVEAAACGTPAIASDSPGLRESVVDGETGFLVEPDNPDAFSGAMIRMAGNRQLVEDLGRAGREFAEGLSWDRAAAHTREHLLETLAVPASAGRELA